MNVNETALPFVALSIMSKVSLPVLTTPAQLLASHEVTVCEMPLMLVQVTGTPNVPVVLSGEKQNSVPPSVQAPAVTTMLVLAVAACGDSAASATPAATNGRARRLALSLRCTSLLPMARKRPTQPRH
jgi:hypothetical protein